jgi:Fic family protein
MFVTSHAHPEQRIAIDVAAQIIPSALAKIDTSIARNPGLDDCSRIALTYFEVLRIHPFADGNGRVARAFANSELRRIRNSIPIPIFDLTAAVYHSLDRHNALLASTDTSVYARWRNYFAGLVQTEPLFAQRLSRALGQLRSIELTQPAGALEGDAATDLSAAVSRIIASTKIA